MNNRAETLDLKQYIAVVLRHKWLIVQVVAIAGIAAYVFSYLQTPMYTATTQLNATPQAQYSVYNDRMALPYQDAQRRIQTQLETFKSAEVAELAKKKSGFNGKPSELLQKVSVSAVGTSDVLEVRATDPSPTRAAKLANAMAESFIEFQAAGSVKKITELLEEVKTKLGEAKARFDSADAEMSRLLGDGQTAAAEALQSKRDAALEEYSTLKQSADDLEIQSRLQQQFASVIERATVPTSPSAPRPMRNAALAILLGLALGVGLAFLKEHLDDSIRSMDELEELVAAPLIGVIPAFDASGGITRLKRHTRRHTDDEDETPHIVQLKTAAAEAFRRLRTNLQFLGLDQPLRIVGVTSARANEGKSTVTSNLAVTMAQAGLRVILVGGDLRKPTLHEVFGKNNTLGVSTLLTGESKLEDTLIPLRVEGTSTQIWFLPSGPTPPNPAEMLGSRRMEELLKDLANRCDIVLIDLPPVMAVSDTVVVCAKLDGVILLSRAGMAKQEEVLRSRQAIEKVGGRTIGCVLNAVEAGKNSGYYGYEYYYEYYTAEEATVKEEVPAAPRNGNGAKHAKPAGAAVAKPVAATATSSSTSPAPKRPPAKT